VPPAAPALLLYTVGHSTRTVESLSDIVGSFHVAVIVDVRRFPTSRRWPWWSRESMEKTLPERGFSYVWLGDLLGGMRKGGYEAHMQSQAFRCGILEVRRLAGAGVTSLLCAEKDFRRCHRRFIADALVREGVKVFHIVEAGFAEPHPFF
jgi:uncharacterized protein (DUF488 family)